MARTLTAFIAEHVARVEPLQRDLNLAAWAAATTGRDEDNERAAALQAEMMRIYADPSAFARLQAWEEVGPPADPLLARQLRVLYYAYARGQQDEPTIQALTDLEKEVRNTFYNFRGLIAGQPVSDNEIANILRDSTDSEQVRLAWEAGKQIGPQVANRVRAMARLRNAAAQRQGYADYYRMSLELDEIAVDRLFDLLDELARLTDRPFRAEKAMLDAELADRFGVSADQLRPWHYGDPFFQHPPRIGSEDLDRLFAERALEPLAVRTYDGLGLDVRDILARSDLYARPGKDQHAFCEDIDRKGDVRVLCNLESTKRWMNTILHELGHAVYDQHLDPELPWLLRTPAHIITTEAIAELMGELSLDGTWLRAVLAVPEPEIVRLERALRARSRLEMLIFVRWVLVMVHFERALYADPEQELDALWWDLVERYQLVRRPDGRAAPDWAAKMHLALAPAYYQNYLLGELMASQIRHVVGRDYGELVDRAEAGRYLVEAIFRPGNRQNWEKLIERATGEPLRPAYFVEEFVSAVGGGR